MKHFGRSLLNPTPASILSTFATETSSGEPTSNATPFSSKRVDRNGDGMVGRGEFCLLGGNEQTFRKASANEGRS
jgi:hypothetical protein